MTTMTTFLLILAAIAAAGIVFEIIKEYLQSRKEALAQNDDTGETFEVNETPVQETKSGEVFKTIQFESTPTPTPVFKEESKSTTADYLSYAGTTVSNEAKTVSVNTEAESSKKKKEYKPRKPKDGKKGGKKEFKKKGKKGGDDKLLLS